MKRVQLFYFMVKFKHIRLRCSASPGYFNRKLLLLTSDGVRIFMRAAGALISFQILLSSEPRNTH